MKALIVMAALAASIATGALAMVNSSGNLSEIQSYAPNADVSTLTDREIGRSSERYPWWRQRRRNRCVRSQLPPETRLIHAPTQAKGPPIGRPYSFD